MHSTSYMEHQDASGLYVTPIYIQVKNVLKKREIEHLQSALVSSISFSAKESQVFSHRLHTLRLYHPILPMLGSCFHPIHPEKVA